MLTAPVQFCVVNLEREEQRLEVALLVLRQEEDQSNPPNLSSQVVTGKIKVPL